MEKVKKIVNESREVDAVQITKKEFVDITAKECANVFMQLSHSDNIDVLDILVPLVCAKFSANVMNTIFGDKNEESEDKCNG
jgi:hypothetical protein